MEIHEVISTNWQWLLTFATALLGGVPGILSIIKSSRKPIVDIYPPFSGTIVDFGRDGEEIRSKFVLLPVSIINNGDDPLVPRVMNLYRKNGLLSLRWGKWRPRKLEDHLHSIIELEDREIVINNPSSRDIHRFDGAITKERPVHGLLMFSSGALNVPSDNEVMRLKLEIEGVNKKKFSYYYKSPRKGKVNSTGELMKMGIYAQHKKT